MTWAEVAARLTLITHEAVTVEQAQEQVRGWLSAVSREDDLYLTMIAFHAVAHEGIPAWAR